MPPKRDPTKVLPSGLPRPSRRMLYGNPEAFSREYLQRAMKTLQEEVIENKKDIKMLQSMVIQPWRAVEEKKHHLVANAKNKEKGKKRKDSASITSATTLGRLQR
eukprot:1508093-Pyramimonas_sp.AAC.2